MKKPASCAFFLTLALAAASCGGATETESKDPKQITVGVSGAFAESQIVAEMYAQVLEEEGYEVKRQLDLESREISQKALENGQIDVKPEYLGSLAVYLKGKAATDPDVTEKELSRLLAKKDLILLERMEADDTNALVVTKASAKDKKLTKVSDLEPIAKELIVGGPPECPSRPFCLPGFRSTYGLEFKEFKPLDVGGPLTVSALEGGEVDVAVLFTTSGAIAKKGFVALEDDKGLQTAENIAAVIRKDAFSSEVEKLLNTIHLTTKEITELNARVEIDKEDPADVAKKHLQKQGLI